MMFCLNTSNTLIFMMFLQSKEEIQAVCVLQVDSREQSKNRLN